MRKYRRESDNVEDRRGDLGSSGNISMGTIMMFAPLIKRLLRSKFGLVVLAVGLLAYMNGYNPLALLGVGGASYSKPLDKAKDDKEAAFMKGVLADTEDVWRELLPKYGLRYSEPTMVLYRGQTSSGCGRASSQMGPFYCPADKRVYLDLSFFDELAKRHNAPGDFAQAYVLAHEIGHHIQDIQGTLDKVQRYKQKIRSEKKSNAIQVRVELQADCYSGVWAHHAQKRFNILEEGDIDEALQAASSIGDDVLQKKAQGYVRPDSFTHGSARERVEWFKRGFESGDLRACNTFK
ncbi:YpfJ protein, zinc metalloprotease superfamily [hydrothermal vent metagenome]|uniref:YpfJ protein, zinc metalloprotease superfamily n=1 Tax=hydrothermal vent metagenome TaxID=652676 RepID=A0A1W1BPG7_9ZZZZ